MSSLGSLGTRDTGAGAEGVSLIKLLDLDLVTLTVIISSEAGVSGGGILDLLEVVLQLQFENRIGRQILIVNANELTF